MNNFPFRAGIKFVFSFKWFILCNSLDRKNKSYALWEKKKIHYTILFRTFTSSKANFGYKLINRHLIRQSLFFLNLIIPLDYILTYSFEWTFFPK